MKTTEFLVTLLNLDDTVVESFADEHEAFIVKVRPAWKAPHCSQCGASTGRPLAGRRVARCWTHCDIMGTPVVLQYRVRRVMCPECGEVLEAVPWANDVTSEYTKLLEQEAARVASAVGSTRSYCELLHATRSSVFHS